MLVYLVVFVSCMQLSIFLGICGFFLGHFIEQFLIPGKHPKCNGREGESGHAWGCWSCAWVTKRITSETILYPCSVMVRNLSALSLVSTLYFFIGIITTNLFFRNGLPLGFIHWKFSFWFFIMNAWRKFCFLLFKN